MDYPTNRPIVPVMVYDPMMPPIIPQTTLGLPSEVTQHSGRVAALIINEAGAQANNNAVRMYCYNALADNGFNNPFFQEVFDLAMGSLALAMKKSPYTSALQHIKGSVEQALGLMTSVLLYREQSLRSLVTPRQNDAAAQNAPVLANLKQEIESMFASTPFAGQFGAVAQVQSPQVALVNTQMGPALAVQMPNGQTQQFPVTSYNNQYFVNINNQNFPVAQTQQGVAIMVNNQWMPAAAVFMPQQQQMPQSWGGMPNQNMGMPPDMRGGNSRFASGGSTFAKDNNQGAFNIKQGDSIDHRYDDSHINTRQAASNQQTVSEPVVAPIAAEVGDFKVLSIKGDKMGAREVRILGQAFSLDGVVRKQEVRDAIIEMGSLSTTDEDSSVLHPNQIYSTNIDDAILTSRIEQLTRSGSNSALYRIFGITLNPIIGKHKELEDFVMTIRKSLSITEIANRLRSMGEALNSDVFDKHTATELATMLAYIDRMLTDLTNRFLAVNMREGAVVAIGSFAEDGADLPQYLQRTRGQASVSAFEVFEKSLLENFNSILLEGESSAIEALGLAEDLIAVCVPTGYSITHTCLTRDEFGFNLENEPAIIDRQVAPELYKICQTLGGHKKVMDAFTQEDFLITSDGERYRLYTSAIKMDQYLIQKV